MRFPLYIKKVMPASIRSIICSIIILLASVNAYANHILGMDLNYAWVSGNTYRITAVIYGNCGSASLSSGFRNLPRATPEVCIYNGGTYVATIDLPIDSALSFAEVTPVCPRDLDSTQCTSLTYTIPGVKKFTYSALYTVPSASPVWRFIFDGNLGPGGQAGRASTIGNISGAGGTYIHLVDTLNNTINNLHNSSPDLTVLPTPFFCADENDNYNPGAVDPDMDSLAFYLVAGSTGSQSCASTYGTVSYTGGTTAADPLSASGFSFNSSTGQISFNPIIQTSLVIYNIEEYRHGALADTLVGTSQREMTFIVITCTNLTPTDSVGTTTGGITIDDSTHYHICADTGPFSITLDPREQDTSNSITVTASGLPTGATLVVTNNGTNDPQATVSWTSTGVPVGSYTFYLNLADNNCPLAGQQTLAYTISIYPVPTLSDVVVTQATCTDSATVNLIPGGVGQPWSIELAPGDTITNVNGDTLVHLVPGNDTVTIYTSVSRLCYAQVVVPVAAPSIAATGTFTNPTFCGNNDGSITLSGLTAGNIDNLNFLYGGVAQPAEAETVSSGGNIVLANLCAGDYSNIIVSSGYCATTPLEFDLSNPPFSTIRIGADTTNPTSCGASNGIIKIYGLHPGQTDTIHYTFNGTPETAFNYVGTDSILILSGLVAGTYDNMEVTTGGVCNSVAPNNCSSNIVGPMTLTQPGIAPMFTDVIHYGCSGDTVVFTNLSTAPGSAVIDYTWNFGDGTSDTAANPTHVFLNTNNITYSVTLTLNNVGCDSTVSQLIVLNNFVSASFLSAPVSFACQDSVVSFNNTSAGTNLSYTWSFGDGGTSSLASPTYVYPNTGNYTVTLIATNFVPCSDTAVQTLSIDSNSIVSLHLTDSAICRGQAVTLTGYYSLPGLTNVSWAFGDGTFQGNVDPVVHAYETTGLLTISLHVDYRACPSYTISKNIFVAPVPQINVGADTSICPGSTAIVLADNINGDNPSARWLWSTGATSSSILVNSPGQYYATVTIGGCSASDSVAVLNDCYMDIPNAFTPNNDGTNDYFYPRQYLTKGLVTFKMDIYNRWGQNIFETTSLDGRGWDGSFNNTPQPEGVYVYVIDATFKDGQKEHRQGNITLLR